MNKRMGMGAVSALALMGVAMSAQAQTPAAAASSEAPDDNAVETVVVTGSRLQLGFTTPTPVSVIGVRDFQRVGTTNVVDAVNQLPAFRASRDQTTAGTTSTRQGQYYLDLRGLGTNRTLTLVDGRRVVSSATTGEVDANLIPSNLVERVDAVTGGASAAYGSDAVAGVANIILVKRMTGIQASAQYGVTEVGDGSEYRAALAGGAEFGGGRGHLVAGGEYVESHGVGDAYTRDWGREEWGLISNPRPGAAGPSRIISKNAHYSVMSRGGMVTAGPLKGLTFLGGGQTGTFNYGIDYGLNQIGGDQYGLSVYSDFALRTPVTRYSLLGRAEYEVSDALTVAAEVSTSHSRSLSLQSANRDTGTLTIRSDNPFLPASVVQKMAAANVTTLTVGRYARDLHYPNTFSTSETLRAVLSAEGELGKGWSWDAYFQHGESEYEQVQYNRRINSNWTAALDAVRAPSGQIVCRSTLTNPTNGCVPIDIFGVQAPGSQSAAIAYISGTANYLQKQAQDAGAFNLRGQPFSTWAGPVLTAVGGEFRHDKINAVSDPLSNADRFSTGNYKNLSGAQSVKEVYGEIAVPLAKDLPLASSLDLNAAGRRTDYSISGAVSTWKVGATYRPVDDLMLRVTRSHDIRAPNLSELFNTSVLTLSVVRNPYTGLNPISQVFTVGNRDLTPEIAETFTAGATFSPSFVPRLRISVDFFRIKIANQITSLGAQTLVDRCFAGATEFCQFVTYSDNVTHASITRVTNALVNTGAFRQQGEDYEVAYNFPVSAFRSNWGGSVDLRLLATHTSFSGTTDTVGAPNRAGQNGAGGTPSWLATFIASYSNNGFTAASTVRFISKGKIDTTLIGPDDPNYSPSLANSISDNEVPAFAYLNLSLSQDLKVWGDRKIQVFGVINNVFDTDPAIMPSGVSMTNPAYYDVLGRSYRVGVRLTY